MVVGCLTRYNKKTVTVITDIGERWNVALICCIGSSIPPTPAKAIQTLSRCARNAELDDEEDDLVTRAIAVAEVERMIADGEIRDGVTVATFGLLRLKGYL